MKIITTLSLLICLATLGLYGQGAKLFDNGSLHEIRITFQEDDFWQILSDNYFDGGDPFSGGSNNIEYLMCSISVDGEVTDSVGLRQKGFSSHFASVGKKKSLKVDVNEFVSGQKIDGLKKFNIHNGVGDPGFSRDFIAYHLMRRMGVKVPRVAYTKLYLNDTYWGLYALVEQVDKTFLENNFSNGDGNLFKNMGNSELLWEGPNKNQYKENIALKTNEAEDDWTAFVNFIDVLNNSSDTEFAEKIKEVFDVEYYLKVLSVDLITDNWDSYIEHGRNFYIYYNPDIEKFQWIPWDYNFSLGGDFGFGDPFGGPETSNLPNDRSECSTFLEGTIPHDYDEVLEEVLKSDPTCCLFEWDSKCQSTYVAYESGDFDPEANRPNLQNIGFFEFQPSKVLIQKILAVPQFREIYLDNMCKLVNIHFSSENLDPIVDANADLIRNSVFDDVNNNFTYLDFEYDVAYGTGRDGIPSVKEFIREKISFAKDQLDENFFSCLNDPNVFDWHDIVINEFVASNDSLSGTFDQDGDADDWIELYNTTDEDIDLGGFYLSDTYSNIGKWTIPPNTIIAPQSYIIIWCDEDDEQEGLHANFKLSKSGESIILSDSNFTAIDSLSYLGQETNVASARIPNGIGDFIQQGFTFAYNNDDFSALDNLDQVAIKIYPNPAQNLVNVSMNEKGLQTYSHIDILNSLGQLVNTTNIKKEESMQFDLGSMTNGLYWLQFRGFSKSKAYPLLISR